MGLNVFLRAGAMTRPPSVSPVTNREIRWGRTITLTVIENEPQLREGSHRNYGNTPKWHVPVIRWVWRGCWVVVVGSDWFFQRLRRVFSGLGDDSDFADNDVGGAGPQ